VGANTEDIVNLRTSIRHNRLTPWGSSAEAQLYASYFKQDLQLQGNWFYTPPPDQKYLSFRLTGDHENKRKGVEVGTLSARMEPTYFGDQWGARYQYAFGPSYNLQYQFTDPRGAIRHLSLFVDAEVESHEHEYYAGDPLEGYRVTLNSELAAREFLSQFSALRVQLDTENLWMIELGRLQRMVLGLRTQLFETFRWELSRGSALPETFRSYLGGSENLRGFGRNDLPLGYEGALSSFYLGAEARFKNFFGPIEPLAFVDFGAMGRRHLDFSPPYYMSPGLGARWKTPFGTIRSTLALGFLSRGGNILVWKARSTKVGWPFQFYFSWGEEF
jgi:outer membrane translocation and assembly module TamA